LSHSSSRLGAFPLYVQDQTTREEGKKEEHYTNMFTYMHLQKEIV